MEKNPKVFIVSMFIGELSYKDVAIENHKNYCDKHGYEYVYFTEPLIPYNPNNMSKSYIWWMKPEAIFHCFKKGADYVFWMDGDSFFINTDIKITDFNPDNKYDFIVTGDHNDITNAGHLLFKNSEWSKSFIEEWLKYKVPMNEKTLKDFINNTHNCNIKDEIMLGDQTALNIMLSGGNHEDQNTWVVNFNKINFYPGNHNRHHNSDYSPVLEENLIKTNSLLSDRFRNNVKILHQRSFNSYKYHFEKDDFVIHFVGEKDVDDIKSYLS